MPGNFPDDGYLLLDVPLPDDLLDAVAAATAGPLRFPETRRRQDAWRESPAVRDLARFSAVLAELERLYGRRPLPFQTLNFQVGTQQRAHSDTIHFHTRPAGWMCGVWVALEPVDADNGPLVVYPGSHKLPAYTMQDFGLRASYADYPAYEDAIARVIAEQRLVPRELHLRRGQAVVWHANLLHGGAPIADEKRTRFSQATHYFFDGVEDYYTPMWSDLSRGLIHRRHPQEICQGARD